MKDAVRIFALFVAFTGLASASIAPTPTQALSARATDSIVPGPGPTIDLPAPLPCQSINACFAPETSAANR